MVSTAKCGHWTHRRWVSAWSGMVPGQMVELTPQPLLVLWLDKWAYMLVDFCVKFFVFPWIGWDDRRCWIAMFDEVICVDGHVRLGSSCS